MGHTLLSMGVHAAQNEKMPWNLILLWIGGTAIVIMLMLLVVKSCFPGLLRRLPGGVGLPAVLPEHLDSRIAERVIESNDRVKQAQTALETAKANLKEAVTAAVADPTSAALKKHAAQAQQDVDQAQDVVRFEKSQLHQVMNRSQGLLDRVNWGTVLQYAIFTTLAAVVLSSLLNGITSSPPAGTTPRGVITFLIALVTVGIALILVLSTIVSDSDDRAIRFTQGKEVLTALLGVLGTIVGFYFGSSQDQVQGFDFDPVVITQADDKTLTLSTAVHGGKAPYFFEITSTPAAAPPANGSTDGPIKVKLGAATPPTADVSFVMKVTDKYGRSGIIESKRAVSATASAPPAAAAESNASPPPAAPAESSAAPAPAPK